MTEHSLDAWAASNVIGYLDEQAEAAGVVPDDRTVVVERFRDEIGDWRVCVLSPFGTPVHAPWAMAVEQRLMDHYGMAVETMWSDDGIVFRLPESADELPVAEILVDPDEIDELVLGALPSTSLFSSRFRECAARALLLPRRRPDSRTPLWQQRQRAADLLSVAAKYPSFPILLEASRECLQDVFDVPALRTVLADLRSRKIRLVTVDTQKASPFAQSLLFSWIATYMYEGDAPWPSAAPPRWPSTGTCSASCWGPRSCASSSMPACWPTSSSTCSASATTGGPARPTRSTTCCVASAT